jgi:signal transduction histidine kinase
LKNYEIEAFIKAFLLFLLLQSLLLITVVWQEYTQQHHQLDEEILSKMTLCSYDLKCEEFELDFVPIPQEKLVQKLYKEGLLYSYFIIPTQDDFVMKVTLSQDAYIKQKEAIIEEILLSFVWYILPIILLSILFALYTMYPLKKALDLNDEFVRDILHDFNTPLSSMVINLKLLKKQFGTETKLQRIETNIETMLALEKNLQLFLNQSLLSQEQFEVHIIVAERIGYFRTLYPHITFRLNPSSLKLQMNRDAFVRILDNLISNAAKYNKTQGSVSITVDRHTLTIQDTGHGIAHVEKVFQRYYKEHERGLGIGLHIVKKLCDELGIIITIESVINKGTTVRLDLTKVIYA